MAAVALLGGLLAAVAKVTVRRLARSEPTGRIVFYFALIATLVTPTDCGKCHEKQALEVGESYHATAGEILDSNDAYLAHAAGGAPVAIADCESCHGAKVIIDSNSPNKLSRLSWPNSGIGRLNPDGSKGSCTACHSRHSFDVAQALGARDPDERLPWDHVDVLIPKAWLARDWEQRWESRNEAVVP